MNLFIHLVIHWPSTQIKLNAISIQSLGIPDVT